MGIFEKVPVSGCGISASELAATLNVDKDLLGRSLALDENVQVKMLSHFIQFESCEPAPAPISSKKPLSRDIDIMHSP